MAPAPTKFGKYVLLDRISVGGMAEVFKAKSFGVEGFEKVIAIKRILPSMEGDQDFIAMFVDEAKIAGQLAHANICQLFELGKIDGAHFIAMEYIWGKDLLQVQNRFRKLGAKMSAEMACFVVSKVCEGLDYAHRKRDALGQSMNIVHRDCSPQNILVSYEGEVKLIDFGIAKATSRSAKTVAGVLKGKFGYMSPEQVRGLALDRRSDIFAAGTVLYECLTGERLFQCESDFSTLEKVRNVAIFPPTHFNPSISPELEAVVMKALARNPEDRYQWASELQAALHVEMMRADTMFTAKSLGVWLKDAFADELNRERELMDRYRKIGANGAAPTKSSRQSSGRSADDAARTPPEFDDSPTEIFGELSLAGALAPTEEAEVLVSRTTLPLRVVSEDSLADTAAVDSAAPVTEGLPEDPGGVSAVTPWHPPGTGSISNTAGVPRRGRSRLGGLLKDGAMGLGIAILVLGLVAVGRFVLGENQPRAAPLTPGFIAVTIPDTDAAEVFLDGVRVGAIEGGAPFKSQPLSPGRYGLTVRRVGQPTCVQIVELKAGSIEIVTCRFAARPAPEPPLAPTSDPP